MNPGPIPYLLNPIEPTPTDRRATPSDKDGGSLVELRYVDDYVIADDDPDVRGWRVKTCSTFGERTVGKVEDLVVDSTTLAVRYLLVCLDRDAVATSRDRRILVPVGVARVDEDDDAVRVDGYTSAHLVGIPEFRPGKLSRRYEMVIRHRFAPPGPKAGPRSRRAEDFYANEEFDERSFWAGRRRGGGSIPYLHRGTSKGATKSSRGVDDTG